MKVRELEDTVENIQVQNDEESCKECREECVLMLHNLLHLICISKPQVDLPVQEIDLLVNEIMKFLLRIGPISELTPFVLTASSIFGNEVSPYMIYMSSETLIARG